MNILYVLIILFISIPDVNAMCTCKANCKKELDVKEFDTNYEATMEGKKHKHVAIQKYKDKYQLLIWDEEIICESTWPETCVCDNEKY